MFYCIERATYFGLGASVLWGVGAKVVLVWVRGKEGAGGVGLGKRVGGGGVCVLEVVRIN